MNTQPIPHHDLLYSAKYWFMNGDDFVVTSSRGADTRISAKDLTSCHPAFPDVLRTLITRDLHSDNSLPSAQGSHAYDALEVLINGYIRIPDASGYVNLVSTVDEVDYTNHGPDHVKIRGSTVIIEHIDFEGSTLPLLLDSEPCYFTTKTDILDATYPGWKQRLDVAYSLDLTPTQIGHYIFQTAPSLGESLPEINFE